MASATLLLDAAIMLATAMVYAYVGRVVWRRKLEGDAKLASNLFAVWWIALGLTQAQSGLLRVFAYAGVTDLALFTTASYVSGLVLCVALWGLLYYLLYIFTGNRRLLVPITMFYIVFYAIVIYVTTVRNPVGVNVEPWAVGLAYEHDLVGAPLMTLILLLVLPIVLGAAGYARLFFRVEGATQKYRIGMVSFTILAWFGSALVVSLLGVGNEDWWRIASRAIGFLAAVLIYSAYRPPAWVRERFGVEPVDEARSPDVTG